VPARRWSSFCGRPLSWRAVVLTLEDKIVAEEETMARPRRIRQFDIEAFDDTHEDLDGSHPSVFNPACYIPLSRLQE
jgi:hypothetical protein